jgi:hypothetical protein
MGKDEDIVKKKEVDNDSVSRIGLIVLCMGHTDRFSRTNWIWLLVFFFKNIVIDHSSEKKREEEEEEEEEIEVKNIFKHMDHNLSKENRLEKKQMVL